jgi:hypothetical protein
MDMQEISLSARDCHNCSRTIADTSVCSMSSTDIHICLTNPSRPFHHYCTEVETAAKIIAREDDDALLDAYLYKEADPVETDPVEADSYASLSRVLTAAKEQASTGKGKERHANDNNYEDQLICVVGRLLRGHPYGSHAYQVIKKTIEAGRLYYIHGPDAAYQEVLGAINYAAAMNILISEDVETKKPGKET